MSAFHLFLIGPMGAGKTAVGRRLAKSLELPFVDMDMAIQEKTGVDIGFIFEKEGEAGFRKREARMLRDLASGEPAIIATGGGIVELDENLQLLKEFGNAVFLDASVAWQHQRTRNGLHRPLLDTDDPEAVLHTLYARRRQRYAACAAITIATDARHVGDVTDEVLRLLKAREIHE